MDIRWFRAAMADIAEGAASGTDITQDHEGGSALAETLVDVRARGLFADGHQLIGAQTGLEALDGIALGQTHPNPAGLAQRRPVRIKGDRIARDLAFAELLFTHHQGRNGLVSLQLGHGLLWDGDNDSA